MILITKEELKLAEKIEKSLKGCSKCAFLRSIGYTVERVDDDRIKINGKHVIKRNDYVKFAVSKRFKGQDCLETMQSSNWQNMDLPPMSTLHNNSNYDPAISLPSKY